MKWHGYSALHLKINQLKPFQIEAMSAYSSGKDVAVLQATSSGKSICFQLPALMLQDRQYGLVIVPTLSLGFSLVEDFHEMKLPSIFLHAKTSRDVRKKAFGNEIKCIIATPETVFGTCENFKGILEKIDVNRLAFIAIDEGHLVYEWARFRAAYHDVRKLKTLFSTPIIVTTATMKPNTLSDMQTSILRNPTIIRGTIDRPNVAIKISSYSLATAADMKEDPNRNKWYSTAKQVMKIVGEEERAIVYCAYAEDVRLFCSCLLQFGVQAASFTGKDTNQDKREVFNNMKNGTIRILVGTKAVGLGINFPDLRYIIAVGLPENLELWIQEFGRAGRDQKQSYACILVNEREDIKKIQMWTSSTELSDLQRNEVKLDFLMVWRYYSQIFIGECLRSFQKKYFEDIEDTQEQISAPHLCCSGCEIRSKLDFQTNQTLLLLLKALEYLESKGIDKIYESRLLTWMCGKPGTKDNWISSTFDKNDLDNELSYGCLSSKKLTVSDCEDTIRAILRQCYALGFAEIQLSLLKGKSFTVKHWNVTELGRKVAKGEVANPDLPIPMEVMAYFRYKINIGKLS